MQRNYTRTKGANPNPNMRRNVIILVVAIAAGTTIALLIGFWPSIMAQQQKPLMTSSQANTFLTTNWPSDNPVAAGLVFVLPSNIASISNYFISPSKVSELTIGATAQAILDASAWKNIGLAKGVCIIFVNANKQFYAGGPGNSFTPNGVAVFAVKSTTTLTGYPAPHVILSDASNINKAAMTADGYTFINV